MQFSEITSFTAEALITTMFSTYALTLDTDLQLAKIDKKIGRKFPCKSGFNLVNENILPIKTLHRL
jgi:hypothetical protein